MGAVRVLVSGVIEARTLGLESTAGYILSSKAECPTTRPGSNKVKKTHIRVQFWFPSLLVDPAQQNQTRLGKRWAVQR